jgi:hypothetical protein
MACVDAAPRMPDSFARLYSLLLCGPFFASFNVSEDSEIWCVRTSALSPRIDRGWVTDKNVTLKRLIEAHTPSVPVPPKAVICDEPFYLNRRLALQQGCFMIPLDVDFPFMENLTSQETGIFRWNQPGFQSAEEFLTKTDVFRVVIDRGQHAEIRRNLRRMNVTAEHLFPGLDGLAKSFWQEY